MAAVRYGGSSRGLAGGVHRAAADHMGPFRRSVSEKVMPLPLTAVAGIIDDSSMIGLFLLDQGVADRFRPPLPDFVRRWRPQPEMPPNGCRDGPERMPDSSRTDAGIPPNECREPPEQTPEWRWQPIDLAWLFAL